MLTTSQPQSNAAAGVHASIPFQSRLKVWIIGGGPSLRGFDFYKLRNKTVIAVNESFLSIPWAHAVVSIDRLWIDQRIKALNKFAGIKYLAARKGVDLPRIDGLSYRLTLRTEPGLSEQRPVVHGRTSGYAALNLATLLGYRQINLLGFDHTAPGQHHHAAYAWPSGAPPDLWQQLADDYSTCVPQLAQLGVEVINYGTTSAINAFTKKELTCLQ